MKEQQIDQPAERKIIGYYIKITMPVKDADGNPLYSSVHTFRYKDEAGFNNGMRMAKLGQLKVWLSGPTYEPIKIDFSQVTDVEVDGIDYADSPDFVDAFIANCTYMGREATEDELEAINDNPDFVYEAVQRAIY